MDRQSSNQNAGKTESWSCGCVIVNYNTPDIITRAVNSIKNLVDEIIIIDGSDMRNPSYLECDELELFNSNITVYHVGYNIGHGKGLDMGISKINTDLVVCMDSDAVVIDVGIIEEMKLLMDNNIYGCGLVVKVDENGKTSQIGIDYLHPYFCMFKKSTYKQYNPFINHGAPFLSTMKSINNIKKVVNVDSIQAKVFHEHRRTIAIAGNEWLKNWDRC